jgi:hypothetical protein
MGTNSPTLTSIELEEAESTSANSPDRTVGAGQTAQILRRRHFFPFAACQNAPPDSDLQTDHPMPSGVAFARLAAGICGVLFAPVLAAPLVLNPGTYELTVETLLPHLEENLRYATTHQRHCLGTQEATTLFPILLHQAFTGCVLAGGQTVEDRLEYSLQCSNREAASGVAHLTISPTGFNGVLEIKMGGKNMTLAQRITGPRLGACGSEP